MQNIHDYIYRYSKQIEFTTYLLSRATFDQMFDETLLCVWLQLILLKSFNWVGLIN